MSESNVSNGTGGHTPAPVSSLGPPYSNATPTSGLGHLTSLGDTLSFGLGLFPDHDPASKSALPPFSSFGDPEGANDSLSGRFLDLGIPSASSSSSWDLYGEGLSARLIDVGAPTTFGFGIGVGLGIGINPPAPTAVPASVAASIANSQIGSQYRPWETKMSENGPPTLLELGRMNPHPAASLHSFQDPFTLQNSAPKLPSFQSQFHTFSPNPPPPGPPAPVSSSGPLSDAHFHGNPSMVPQRYPLVPTPIQPRPEVPGLPHTHPHAHHQPPQQFAPDERHHLAPFGGFVPDPRQQGMLLPHHRPMGNGPAVSSTIKHEQDPSRSPFNPNVNPGIRPGAPVASMDGRKKEKRKYRTSSLDNGDSDMAGDNPTNLPIISSTTPSDPGSRGPGFKHPGPMSGSGQDPSMMANEKQTKKKRKRCGECIGCMRKDNCGSCAPCRNDKSHQICKMRRCDKLTEKKVKVPRGEKEPRGRGSAAAAASSAPSAVVSTPPAPSHSPGPNWDSYTPNTTWQTNAGGNPTQGNEEGQWSSFQPPPPSAQAILPPPSEEGRFEFGDQSYMLSHNFHAPAPVPAQADAFSAGSNPNRGRPNSQSGMLSPAAGMHGSFSPHPRVSPHPSPGGMNGRSSVPPHSQQQSFIDTGLGSNNGNYPNGSPFASPLPRPPSSNPGFDSGNPEKGIIGTGHPNGQPGYPSSVPHQSSLNSRGYPGHPSSVQGDSMDPRRAELPHEELNSRLKEKILYKQQQKQFQEQLDYFQQQHHQQHYYGGGDGNPTLNDSNGASVRLNVHVEDRSNSDSSTELRTATSLPQMISRNQQQQQQHTSEAMAFTSGNPTSPHYANVKNSVSLSPSWNDSSATNSSDALMNMQNNIKDQSRPLPVFPAGP